MIFIESITWNNREDQWHNRLHLAPLENGIIGLLFSIMWKSLVVSNQMVPARHWDGITLPDLGGSPKDYSRISNNLYNYYCVPPMPVFLPTHLVY